MIRTLVLAAGLLPALPAAATGPVAPGTDRAAIEGNAASGVTGMAAINVASGVSNAQANVRVLASAATTAVVARASQHVDTSRIDVTRDAQAVISSGALGDLHGSLALNQAAGGANAQLNLLAIGVGGGDITLAIGQQVDSSVLAATAAGSGLDPTPSTSPAPLREARIDPGAMGRASGVLQVNQTGGVGNASSNAIVLQLPGGTP